MTGLDAKLPWEQEQGNTDDQNALENKKEILAFFGNRPAPKRVYKNNFCAKEKKNQVFLEV